MWGALIKAGSTVWRTTASSFSLARHMGSIMYYPHGHMTVQSLITMILMRERRHRWNARPSLAICRIRFLSRINLRSRRRSAMPVIQRRARWMGMGNAHRTGGRAAHSPHQSTCNMRLGREQVPISVIPVSIAPCAPRIIHQAMKIQPGDLCLPN